MSTPRMRLLKEAAEELKQLDPKSAVSPYLIRQLAIQGEIKSVMAGRKRLINFDDLLEYFGQNRAVPPETNKIRRIV